MTWSELARDRLRQAFEARCELDLACTYALRNPLLAFQCARAAFLIGNDRTRRSALALMEALGYDPHVLVPATRLRLASRTR